MIATAWGFPGLATFVGRAALAAAGAIAIAAGSLGLSPRAVAAAGEITFGEPSATAEFGTGITFSQPVEAPGVEARSVEVLLTGPDSIGPVVHQIAQTGQIGSSTFEYRLRDDQQHIYPNTTLSAIWRVIDTQGTVTMGPTATVTYTDTRFEWQTELADLVRVHWYRGDDAFGKRALAIGQAGIAKAEELLGVKETKPVDFYVYGDLQAFYGALGPATRENVGGEALPEIRTLFALITPDQIDASWVGVVIPHELTHLVFDTAIRNPYHDPPRWLNEGLAVYLSQGLAPSDRALVDAAVGADELIPLGGLSGQFPTRRDKFALAYAESASALDFMIRRYGRDSFVKLVQSYTAGVTDDAAFVAALGVDTAGFETAWLADIGADVPVAHGPKPDPVGPLPSGWSASPVAVPSGLPPVTGPTAPPLASGSLTGSPSTTSAAGASVAAPSSSAAGSVSPMPTLAGPPSAPAPSGAQASLAPIAGTTPGAIPDDGPVVPPSTVGLASLFAVLALVLGGLGVGLLLIRRERAPLPGGQASPPR